MLASDTKDFLVITGLMHTPKSFIVMPTGQFLKKRPFTNVKPGGVGSTQRPNEVFNTKGLGQLNDIYYIPWRKRKQKSFLKTKI